MVKNVLVTGVSKGLGLETVKALLNSEYRVFGISRTATKDLNDLKDQFADRLKLKQLDLSLPAKIKQEIRV